ncbi:uncharacterized protein LOC107484412 [Arachis duranensis]|uniref:Uncharacterized protein LOC107484412 n=1 Tax=Arachis duranensis TaxID=130453 RepID=A0A6P4D7A4_ARADU|nr:uncharacterized protein LOC107484412 [Arachis duranensis]
MKKLFYKIPIAVVSTDVKYDTFVISTDEDIRVLFHCLRSFPEVKIHELYAKLEVGVDSSGASAPVPSSTTMGGASSSMTAVVPNVPYIASPSFAVDLNHTEAVGFREPDGVENAMRDDDEPVDINGNSDDDIGANPQTHHGPSSSSTQQYPLHFSTLNLEALGQQANGDAAAERSSTEVLESDHLKYHGKCKEFGKGCSWLIRISLRARKGTWEVRSYNGPHTCLATSISNDHWQLDYHIICARIYPLVRADAAFMIKVLQQATKADYGFRPSYRKVWMAKPKVVAQIYGNWEKSYAELPCWMLGVQSTMAGTVTVLKTSPIRVGD